MKEIRVKVLYVAAVAVGAVMFSGCAPANGYIDAKMLTKDNQVKGIRTTRSASAVLNTNGYTGYQDINNAHYRCSMRARLYTIAKESLKRGYPYFALRFPDGSNPSPYAVNSTEKAMRYCVPGYYDKDTNLLDDKCGHIGFGNGTPTGVRRLDGIFYKKRNPFIPMWDAKKTIRDLEPKLREECWKDRDRAFEEVMNGDHDFGTMEMD